MKKDLLRVTELQNYYQKEGAFNLKDNSRSFKIGEIYVMCFSGTGSEQQGLRPGLVFQNNLGNIFSPNLIALPLTSSLKKCELPTHVIVLSKETGLKRDSMVLCENPERMSKEKVGRYLTTLSCEYMQKIASAYLLATSAMAFLDKEVLLSLWEQATRLNFSAQKDYERIGGYV